MPIDSVAFAKLDLAQLLETSHLPADEAVVEGVRIRRDHGPAPVNAAAESSKVCDALLVIKSILILDNLATIPSRHSLGKYVNQYAGSAKLAMSSRGMPRAAMIYIGACCCQFTNLQGCAKGVRFRTWN